MKFSLLKRSLSYFLAAACIAVCCIMTSCSRKAKPIPRGKLAKIYAELFMLDQRIGDDYKLGRIADTTQVYEAVFEKYGYTWENYVASREKYLNDPERYSRIIKKAVNILTAEQRELEETKRRLDEIERAGERMKLFRPNRIYLLDTLKCDSLGRIDTSELRFDFDFQLGLDTAFAGPRMIVWADTVTVVEAPEDELKEDETKGEK